MQHVVLENCPPDGEEVGRWSEDRDDDGDEVSSWPAELLRSMPALQHFTSANLPSEVLPGLLADAAGCESLAHLELEAATCPNELRSAVALLASGQCSASLRALLLHCPTDEQMCSAACRSARTIARGRALLSPSHRTRVGWRRWLCC